MFMSKTISAGKTALAASVNAAFTVERRLSEQPVQIRNGVVSMMGHDRARTTGSYRETSLWTVCGKELDHRTESPHVPKCLERTGSAVYQNHLEPQHHAALRRHASRAKKHVDEV